MLEREMIKISEDQSKDVLDKNENKEVYYDKLVRYYKFISYDEI